MMTWEYELVVVVEETIKRMTVTEIEKINLRISFMMLVSDMIFGRSARAYEIAYHNLRFPSFQESESYSEFSEPRKTDQLELLNRVVTLLQKHKNTGVSKIGQ